MGRLLKREWAGDEHQFTPEELGTVCISGDTLYRHKVLRVNYTTYDMRRAQDSLNPRTHADFMVLGHEEGPDAYPYWFGRIVGIFHADVLHAGAATDVERMDFLWVRWFVRDSAYKSGSKAKRLCRVAFDIEEDFAFGFLDPQEIIRAVHLIPAFAHGRSNDALGPSLVRQPQEEDKDWNYYYVCKLVFFIYYLHAADQFYSGGWTETCSCGSEVAALAIVQHATLNISWWTKMNGTC